MAELTVIEFNIDKHVDDGTLAYNEAKTAYDAVNVALCWPTWENKCKANRLATRAINMANRTFAIKIGQTAWYVQAASAPSEGIMVDIDLCE